MEMEQSNATPNAPRLHEQNPMSSNQNYTNSLLSTTNGSSALDQSHWEDDEEVCSAFTPIRPHQYSCSSFLTGVYKHYVVYDCTIASELLPNMLYTYSM